MPIEAAGDPEEAVVVALEVEGIEVVVEEDLEVVEDPEGGLEAIQITNKWAEEVQCEVLPKVLEAIAEVLATAEALAIVEALVVKAMATNKASAVTRALEVQVMEVKDTNLTENCHYCDCTLVDCIIISNNKDTLYHYHFQPPNQSLARDSHITCISF